MKLFSKINKERIEFSVFVVARIIGLLSKFLLLWGLIQFGYKDASLFVSLYYLAFSSVMLLYSNEAHFQMYKDYFSEFKHKFALIVSTKKYLRLMLHHIIIFSLLVILASYYLIDSWKLSIVFFVLLTLEKLIDEIMRFKLFAKEFLDWSIIILIKSICPILFILIFIQVDFRPEMIFIIASFLTFIFILYWKTSKTLRRLFLIELNFISIESLIKYLRDYFKTHVYNQIYSLSSRNLLMIDRWFIKFMGLIKILDHYTVIAQLANTIIVFIDYFFISSKRALYVQNLNSIKKLSSGFVLPALAIIAFITYSVLMFFYMKFSLINIITYDQSVLIGLSFMLYAVTLPYSQFCFWHLERKKVIGIDATFYITALLFIFIIPASSKITSLLLAIIFAHLIRFAFVFIVSLNIVKKYQFTINE